MDNKNTIENETTKLNQEHYNNLDINIKKLTLEDIKNIFYFAD